MPEPAPRDLLPEILEALEKLRADLEQVGTFVDVGEWEYPLMMLSTDTLRKVANFRDGVQEAGAIYPDQSFEDLESPDLEDPDLLASQRLCDWFMLTSDFDFPWHDES